ncbi:hypothetical protein [Comamonas sp. C11]|uniref:hypothetical protein n=1 Tax=Comamonas sp. C11 TaxID=2966554 RepID=UPI0021132DE6|nr:hypothetical protein [Comamonas sp. C11]UUC91929.1 hypothetical protein NOX35_16660 [Comamonas sp. C11]
MNMHPETPSGDHKPDALRELYHEAVSEDRGPSVQSSAAVLERARQRAAGVGQQPSEPMGKPAANDRFWLRHALGGMAAVGLVGWLMLQHAAWWSGPDKGKEGERDSRAEAVALPAESQPVPAAADADRAAVAELAPTEAALAQKSTEKKTRTMAEKAPDAMDMEASIAASAPVSRPEADPAPGAAASASLARSAKPAAKEPSRSDEATQPAAPAEAMAQSSRPGAQLPLCPLKAEVHRNTQAAKEEAGKASGIAGKPLHCRPRKQGETQMDDANSEKNASKYIADPAP